MPPIRTPAPRSTSKRRNHERQDPLHHHPLGPPRRPHHRRRRRPGLARQYRHDKIIAGFAGSAADGIALFERLEAKLKESNGNLTRAAVELAKEWRTDRVLRRLEALLVVADSERTFLLTGTGDVIEPEGGVVAIGSGGPYALAAARALVEATSLSAREIGERALRIAGDICIYTNQNITIEEL